MAGGSALLLQVPRANPSQSFRFESVMHNSLLKNDISLGSRYLGVLLIVPNVREARTSSWY